MSSENQLAYVSFAVYQDVERPEFWTAYFGRRPDISAEKGDHRMTSSGTRSKFPARVGVWGISSKHAVCSDRLEPHLRYLIESLGLPRADLREVVRRTGAQIRFFCYWDNESGERVPDMPADIGELCESQGIALEIDEYR